MNQNDQAGGGPLDGGVRAQAPKCSCGDRPLVDCPGEFEQGCDLGANAAFVRVAPDIAAEVDKALGIARVLGGAAKPGRAPGSEGD